MSDNLIRLRLLGPCRVRGGALYNAGEVAAFTPEIAEEFLRAGAAEVVELVEETEEDPEMTKKPANEKALQQPPAHKQIRYAPNKGGRRP